MRLSVFNQENNSIFTAKINDDVTRSILYYQLSCVGSESSISSCNAKLARNYNIVNNCYYPSNPAAAMVSCKKSTGKIQLAIQSYFMFYLIYSNDQYGL